MLLKLTTDRHEASRGLFATAELLVWEDSGGDTFCQRCGECGQEYGLVPVIRKKSHGVLSYDSKKGRYDLGVWLTSYPLPRPYQLPNVEFIPQINLASS